MFKVISKSLLLAVVGLMFMLPAGLTQQAEAAGFNGRHHHHHHHFHHRHHHYR